jgi:adenylate cyclase class 2
VVLGASEVEAKIVLGSCDRLGEVRRRLEELGAKLEGEVYEEDTYYQHPCRNFAETDEALRLRIADGRVELTYKGPKRVHGGVKEREELTARVEDGAYMARILERLGFKPVATVRKRRLYYSIEGLAVVSLDTVEGLGCFVEIEYRGKAGSPEEAAEAVERLAERLGLAGLPRTVKSYLELLLEKYGGLTAPS